LNTPSFDIGFEKFENHITCTYGKSQDGVCVSWKELLRKIISRMLDLVHYLRNFTSLKIKFYKIFGFSI
jgi:hypothetical protein